eukprot:scaffold24_cov341-Pavlova_lutheri.AAC.15
MGSSTSPGSHPFLRGEKKLPRGGHPIDPVGSVLGSVLRVVLGGVGWCWVWDGGLVAGPHPCRFARAGSNARKPIPDAGIDQAEARSRKSRHASDTPGTPVERERPREISRHERSLLHRARRSGRDVQEAEPCLCGMGRDSRT